MKTTLEVKLDELKEEFNELIKENGPEMYEGIFEYIDKLKGYDESEEWEILKNDYLEWGDEEYLDGWLIDCIDRRLMGLYKEKFIENLFKMGHKYDFDDEFWDILDKDGSGDFVTCYGLVWDYWYCLDTSIREMVSEIMEEGLC